MSYHPHGSGTLYQRADGRWTAQLQLGGRRVQVYGRTRAEAQGKLDELSKQALLYGTLPDHQTLHTLLDYYLQVGRERWKPTSAYAHERLVLAIRARVPDLPLARVSPSLLQSLYHQFRSTPRRAKYVHQVLHHALKLAVLWGWLPINPADKVVPPAYRKQDRPIWTADQTRAFLAETQDDPFSPLFLTAVHTGLRIGELRGLTWGSIDWKRGLLKVERSVQELHGRFVPLSPKTRAAKRTIHLGPEVLTALHLQQKRTGDLPYVFAGPRGAQLKSHWIGRYLKHLCARLDLPPITMHGFRHLNASLALQAGAPLPLVSRALGHSSPTITSSIYLHAITDGAIVSEALSRALG